MVMPQQIKNYRIIKQIAAGGITSDYLAQNEEIGKKVILRVSNYPIDKKSGYFAIGRMMHIAQLHAKLNHPNIHDLYDFFAEEGFLWTVLKHIEGQTLQEYIAQHGPLKWKSALQLALQISDALAYMHQCGVVNGGLKPKNILMERGHLYISKFNGARALPQDDTVPPNAFIGTRIYCAPEQLQGFAYTCPQSDIWSLGVVLHEMLATTSAVKEDSEELCFSEEKEREIAHFYPEYVPYEVTKLLHWMLEKSLEKRCSSCQELSERIRTLLTASNAFIVMPFHSTFQKIREVIKSVCTRLGVNYYLVDEQHETGDIVFKIRSNIQKADFVIADVSPVGTESLRQGQPMANSNVLYELGLAHGCNKATIILTQDLLTLSFDIAKENAIVYHTDKLDLLEQELAKFINNILKERK